MKGKTAAQIIKDELRSLGIDGVPAGLELLAESVGKEIDKGRKIFDAEKIVATFGGLPLKGFSDVEYSQYPGASREDFPQPKITIDTLATMRSIDFETEDFDRAIEAARQREHDSLSYRSWALIDPARTGEAHDRSRALERLITVKNFPIDVRWSILLAPWRGFYRDLVALEITMVVPDRETGVKRDQGFSKSVLVRNWVDGPINQVARALARAIRRFLLDAIEHEVDEAIHVGPERVFDPHALKWDQVQGRVRR